MTVPMTRAVAIQFLNWNCLSPRFSELVRCRLGRGQIATAPARDESCPSQRPSEADADTDQRLDEHALVRVRPGAPAPDARAAAHGGPATLGGDAHVRSTRDEAAAVDD